MRWYTVSQHALPPLPSTALTVHGDLVANFFCGHGYWIGKVRLVWGEKQRVGRVLYICIMNVVSVVNGVHKCCQCPKCCDVRNAKLAYLFFRVPLKICVPECPCF